MSTELRILKKELRAVIDELENIAEGIQDDFVGIGNEYCAASLRDVAKEYRKLRKRLEAAIAAEGEE